MGAVGSSGLGGAGGGFVLIPTTCPPSGVEVWVGRTGVFLTMSVTVVIGDGVGGGGGGGLGPSHGGGGGGAGGSRPGGVVPVPPGNGCTGPVSGGGPSGFRPGCLWFRSSSSGGGAAGGAGVAAGPGRFGSFSQNASCARCSAVFSVNSLSRGAMAA